MVSQKQTKLFQQLAVLMGVASASVLVSLPAMAQSKLNPSPSIFSEPQYNRGQVDRNSNSPAPATEAESPTAVPTDPAQPNAQPAPSSPEPSLPNRADSPAGSLTVAQVTASDSSFKTLSAALKAADLEGTLSQAGPYTVFAPTDAAFAALPAGTVESLLKPENKALLVKVLTYHVVPGEVTSDKLSSGAVTTVEGNPVNVQVGDGGVQVNDAKVIKPDVQASNGVIHVIDKVILPPDLQ
jgi:uncharacterized surface protein with fasciclin (FAS1) repeats